MGADFKLMVLSYKSHNKHVVAFINVKQVIWTRVSILEKQTLTMYQFDDAKRLDPLKSLKTFIHLCPQAGMSFGI